MVEVSIVVDSSNLEKFLQQFEAHIAISETAIATEIANMAFTIIKEWAPSPTSPYYHTNSTGNLRDSHELTQISPTTWKIKPMAPYAFYVHYGHRIVPHGMAGVEIGRGKPTRGAMAWVPPRPWISDAKGYIMPHLREIIAQAIRNMTEAQS